MADLFSLPILDPSQAHTITRPRAKGRGVGAGKAKASGIAFLAPCKSFVWSPLTKGRLTIVDLEDADFLLAHLWWADWKGYAVRTVWEGQNIRLHRAILDAPPELEVDHIDGDISNNRRSNLRLASRLENGRNMRAHTKNGSGLKGVFPASKRTWVACIGINGKKVRLGAFPCPAEAARAYDIAAKQIFGEFARLNFPD